jgi:hypothetical protein
MNLSSKILEQIDYKTAMNMNAKFHFDFFIREIKLHKMIIKNSNFNSNNIFSDVEDALELEMTL